MKKIPERKRLNRRAIRTYISRKKKSVEFL